MRIIKPSVEFMHRVDGQVVMNLLEACGRVCYKSEDRIGDGTAESFLRGIIKRGHEAVLEHAKVTVKFTVDRGVSHEIVRHRMASYCQESTRYCNYSGDKFGREITVIEPFYLTGADHERRYALWKNSCQDAERAYNYMLDKGSSPQEARAVLPNSLKTELVMTANIREWRHFLKLRCSKAAHPQMREVAIPLLQMFYDVLPVLFEDVYAEVHGE